MMKTRKYEKQSHILTFGGCYVNLHEYHCQKVGRSAGGIGAADLTYPSLLRLPSEQSVGQQLVSVLMSVYKLTVPM